MESVIQFNNIPVVTGQNWPGINYFSTTRLGGFSNAFWESFNLGLNTMDCAANVIANRQRLNAALPSQPVWLNQVHGTQVHIANQITHETSNKITNESSNEITKLGAPKSDSLISNNNGQQIPTADAAVTTTPGQVLAILTADCLPIVIANTNGTALGVAHAGWRGLANGVIENTVQALKQLHPNQNTQWQAWVGPGIHQPAFEVGADVRNTFLEQKQDFDAYFTPASENNKWLANLPALAKIKLQNAGIKTVHINHLCTFKNTNLFYSYRRNNVTGRQATLAWINSSALN